MRSPIHRIRWGASVLAAIVVVAVLGYRFLGGYGWVESLWMVVVSITTVGYGERSSLGPGMQLFSIGVIVTGIAMAAYTFGSFMQFWIEGEFETLLGKRRMSKVLQQLQDHVVICGFGRMGRVLASLLHQQGVPFVIIDQSERGVDAAQGMDYLTILGNATEEETLQDARLEHARTLITCLPEDADNVFITLTARNLCPEIHIVSRAEQPSTEPKLMQAGANRVIMPSVRSARLMARMVTRPSTADLIELVTQSDLHDIELDEITVTTASGLGGKTVAETEVLRQHRLLIVGVKQPSGEMIFNPGGPYKIQVGEIVVMLGRLGDIESFRKKIGA